MLLDAAVLPAREQLRRIGALRQHRPAQLEIDRPPVVGVDQREVPQLAALIGVGHARRGQLEQGLGQPVERADQRDLRLERQEIGQEGAAVLRIEDAPHEVLEAALVARIRRGPAGPLLGLASWP